MGPLNRLFAIIAIFLLGAVHLAGCDSGIGGSAFENQPPSTVLAVRDTSLVDNLANSERLTSTVFASWSGTDPDGYVASFEIRYYESAANPGPDEGWHATTRTDSLILLPIERGERVANVAFEVRAVDNEGLKDETPARTVFPIENSPPSIQFNSFELPPDTTYTIFSFSWTAGDPEGEDNLSRIEVSLNDTTAFVPVDPDVDFITLVADFDRDNPGEASSSARLFSGRSFQGTSVTVPDVRLNAENTFSVRAVDQTDTTSVRRDYTWYVKKPTGRVLFVNDYRRASWPVVQDFHLGLLREYLPTDLDVDVWNMSSPFTTGSSGNPILSDAVPSSAAPAFQQTLALWDFIYWVSSGATSSVRGNNLPFAAPVLDLFFSNGGKLMVHTPMTQPNDPEANVGNPAILLLPISQAITLPDSVRRLQLPTGAPIEPVNELPGVSEPLPDLESDRFFISELPYEAEGENVIPLYDAHYEFRDQQGNTGDWSYPRSVASISQDRRVGLFALPLINEQSGEPVLVGADGDTDAARRAVMLMLESLQFPAR